MHDFHAKNVYITGGSTGIGLAVARLMAKRGANIIVFARTRHKLEAALREVQRRRVSSDQRFGYRVLDVAEHSMVQAVMGEAVQTFGPPDVLINCAGRAIPHAFEDITFAQFDETMRINLYGIWNTVAALVPAMQASGGAIVNVASMAGFTGVFGYSDYCASKFGVIGLSEVLRQELRRDKISVHVLCPPDTDTPGYAVENLTKLPETKAISAGARIMSPDEVAWALIKGMARGRFMIIPGWEGKLAYFMKRHVPALVDLFMKSAIRKVNHKRISSSGS
jgi:short-subunit dehydrogenase